MTGSVERHNLQAVGLSSVGVTVAICSQNGASRIARALSHLAQQKDVAAVPWEVLVVDNGSNDGTAAAARAAWDPSVAPLRIVNEPTLGLTHARQRALSEARFDVVSFVDDDNWVDSGWVRSVVTLMSEYPDVGVCGGPVIAEFESAPPEWLHAYHEDLAIGPQASASGDITDRGYVWGTGLTLRRQAWLDACARGFRQQLQDRRGSAVSGGGDVELCLAIRRLGWRIRYDERLMLRHFIPRYRMDAAYIRRLRRAHGASSLVLERAGLTSGDVERRLNWLRRSWPWRFTSTTRRILRLAPAALRARRNQALTDDLLQLEFAFGRWTALLGLRAP